MPPLDRRIGVCIDESGSVVWPPGSDEELIDPEYGLRLAGEPAGRDRRSA
jgi:hypothetical protein